MDARDPKTGDEVREYMASKRASHTVERAREMFSNTLPAFTVFENATGGCLDSLAAAYTGFRHLGGSENIEKATGRAKAKLFRHVTGAKCYGDARQWESWIHEIGGEKDYYKAGMPCV